MSPPATDQRGTTRAQDGNGVGGSVCDIGAFELEGAPPVATATPTRTATPTSTATPTVTPAASSTLSDPVRRNVGGAIQGLFQPAPATMAPAVVQIQPPSTGDGGLAH